MSAFTGQLRVGRDIRVGADDAAPRWTVRVQVSDAWDAVRFDTPSTEPVLTLKLRALEALRPDEAYHDDYVVKLHGVVVHDESATLAEVGATDGSIFLVILRRRRPVR
jgi:hypothetical protein